MVNCLQPSPKHDLPSQKNKNCKLLFKQFTRHAFLLQLISLGKTHWRSRKAGNEWNRETLQGAAKASSTCASVKTSPDWWFAVEPLARPLMTLELITLLAAVYTLRTLSLQSLEWGYLTIKSSSSIYRTQSESTGAQHRANVPQRLYQQPY